jgi:molybdate transport system substrate-binding protein
MKSLCFLAAAALAGSVSLAPVRAAEKITVAAATDLKFVMEEIIASFKASHSADEIAVTYGSSGNLYTRIQQGAPFDIFFSADVGFASALKDKGLAATEPKLYGVGRIVLWSAVRDASKMSLRDLDDPRIRMSSSRINPSNPA